MSETASPLLDVVIAGAGPTGLLLACELRLAGCTVLVLERASNLYSAAKNMPFGLRGLTVPTIEILDRRGLLAPLRQAAARSEAAVSSRPDRRERRDGGHFAGIDFFYDQLDAAILPGRRPGEVPSLTADIATIEALLSERAEALGVEIRRGAEVEGVDQTDDGVVIAAGGRRHRARWLVGCDGGRSTVRKAVHIGFVGSDPEFTGYSIQVALDVPTMLAPGRNLAPGGVFIYAPPGTIWLADFDGGDAHRTTPLTCEHVEAVLRRVSGTDVTVKTLHYASTWTDRAHLATRYRSGRVLVAGDAAHVHSPLGGQGLNLGLGDAMNLGWKLAAVVRGDAPPELLDSYERERRPVAIEVLDRSRAQVALLRPDPGSRVLERIMRDLIATRDGTHYFAERVSGLSLRHDLGEEHTLVGRSVPELDLSEGTGINERLRSGCGLLLAFRANSDLRALAAPWARRVSYVQVAGDGRCRGAALVRPDGIVAWACDGAVDLPQARAALVRWFGYEDRPGTGTPGVGIPRNQAAGVSTTK